MLSRVILGQGSLKHALVIHRYIAVGSYEETANVAKIIISHVWVVISWLYMAQCWFSHVHYYLVVGFSYGPLIGTVSTQLLCSDQKRWFSFAVQSMNNTSSVIQN